MWQLQGTHALLQSDRLTGILDLSRPHLGLHGLQSVPNSSIVPATGANVFRLRLPGGTPVEEVRESWVRGSDLVAVYGPTGERESQPVIYWRALVSPEGIGLELIVSVHTRLLDDDPAISIISEMSVHEAWWVPTARPSAKQLLPANGPQRLLASDGPGSCLLRLSNQTSYIEMVHATDFCGAELTWRDDRVAVKTPLFPDRLEKGVIRRGRLRAWLVPTANDVSTAGRLFQEFTQSEHPLTT